MGNRYDPNCEREVAALNMNAMGGLGSGFTTCRSAQIASLTDRQKFDLRNEAVFGKKLSCHHGEWQFGAGNSIHTAKLKDRNTGNIAGLTQEQVIHLMGSTDGEFQVIGDVGYRVGSIMSQGVDICQNWTAQNAPDETNPFTPRFDPGEVVAGLLPGVGTALAVSDMQDIQWMINKEREYYPEGSDGFGESQARTHEWSNMLAHSQADVAISGAFDALDVVTFGAAGVIANGSKAAANAVGALIKSGNRFRRIGYETIPEVAEDVARTTRGSSRAVTAATDAALDVADAARKVKTRGPDAEVSRIANSESAAVAEDPNAPGGRAWDALHTDRPPPTAEKAAQIEEGWRWLREYQAEQARAAEAAQAAAREAEAEAARVAAREAEAEAARVAALEAREEFARVAQAEADSLQSSNRFRKIKPFQRRKVPEAPQRVAGTRAKKARVVEEEERAAAAEERAVEARPSRSSATGRVVRDAAAEALLSAAVHEIITTEQSHAQIAPKSNDDPTLTTQGPLGRKFPHVNADLLPFDVVDQLNEEVVKQSAFPFLAVGIIIVGVGVLYVYSNR